MNKRERIKDIMGYVKELINDIKEGYDVYGFQAIIKYKNGSVKYINENEGYKEVSLDCSKVEYILYETPDDSIDSNGKSYLRDICYGNIPNDHTQEIWNRYINFCLS